MSSEQAPNDQTSKKKTPNHWVWVQKENVLILYKNGIPFFSDSLVLDPHDLFERADKIGMTDRDLVEIHHLTYHRCFCAYTIGEKIKDYVPSRYYDDVSEIVFTPEQQSIRDPNVIKKIYKRFDCDFSNPLLRGEGYNIFFTPQKERTIWYVITKQIDMTGHGLLEFRIRHHAACNDPRFIACMDPYTSFFKNDQRQWKPGDIIVHDHIFHGSVSRHFVKICLYRESLSLRFDVPSQDQQDISNQIKRSQLFIDKMTEKAFGEKVTDVRETNSAQIETTSHNIETPDKCEKFTDVIGTEKKWISSEVCILISLVMLQIIGFFTLVMISHSSPTIPQQQITASWDAIIDLGNKKYKATRAFKDLHHEIAVIRVVDNVDSIRSNIKFASICIGIIDDYNRDLDAIVREIKELDHGSSL